MSDLKNLSVKASGSWRDVEKAYVKVSGSWREATPWKKINGAWMKMSFAPDLTFFYSGTSIPFRKVTLNSDQEFSSENGSFASSHNFSVSPISKNIYTSRSNGAMKLDSNGNLVWSQTDIRSVDIVIDEEEYVYTRDNFIETRGHQKLDPSNGEIIWERFSPSSLSTSRSMSFGHKGTYPLLAISVGTRGRIDFINVENGERTNYYNQISNNHTVPAYVVQDKEGYISGNNRGRVYSSCQGVIYALRKPNPEPPSSEVSLFYNNARGQFNHGYVVKDIKTDGEYVYLAHDTGIAKISIARSTSSPSVTNFQEVFNITDFNPTGQNNPPQTQRISLHPNYIVASFGRSGTIQDKIIGVFDIETGEVLFSKSYDRGDQRWILGVATSMGEYQTFYEYW